MSFDNETESLPERLRNRGLQDVVQAGKNLAMLGKSLTGEASEVLDTVLSVLSRSADPDQTLNYFERFVGSLGEVHPFLRRCREQPDLLTYLITIFGASRFLSAFLLSDPDRALQLLFDPGLRTPSQGRQRLAGRLNRRLEGVADEKTIFSRLRVFRKEEMLRIALRDLLGRADLRETVEDLSDLAEVCLQAAYAWSDELLRQRYGRPMAAAAKGCREVARFAVIAMGKLGGRELNFSSDVDLMYVYSSDGETEGAAGSEGGGGNGITNHQYFVKLAEKLTAAIGQKTEDGFVFRVDLRLRPEGQRGPLAQSIGGYEIYYESWGQTWERSALIKARPVAGDEGLGREFLDRIAPFVFRKYLDFGAIAEIGDMKQKINKDVELKGRTHRDVKLGYGGIREIEFVVQALQLIYAGRDRALREKNTLKALHALSQKGLISYREQELLARAYLFLRTVEHRIQMLDDLQSQTLPDSAAELRVLARRAGYAEPGREAEHLLRDYAGHTEAVRAVYDDLFAFTGETSSREQAGGEYAMLLNPELPEREAMDLLGRNGFRDPARAYRNLVLLREGAAFVHQTPRSRKLFDQMFPLLFQQAAASPDPDMALNHLESFLAVQGSWEALQPLLRLDARAGTMLVAIFANSEYLSRMLIANPVLLANLLESRKAYGNGTRAVFMRELSEAMRQGDGLPEKLDILRRFKHQEEIRIGLADLNSSLGMRAVSRDLSKLAEVCLEAALNLAYSEIGRRYQSPSPQSGMAVISAGKLGGRELVYASDLDILFVYSEAKAGTPPPGLTVFEYFSKVAEKTISYLSTLTREGFVFRVDTRLRPTGSKGPLVQSMQVFRNYYAGEARTWERQALVRARFVAGDAALGREFCSMLRELIYRRTDRAALAADITDMRKRIEDELGSEQEGFFNIKQGRGGMVDIEFLVQFLQLLYGHCHRQLQVPGTENALCALRRLRLLPEPQNASLLAAYRFLRLIESRLRIVSNQAAGRLPKDPGLLERAALRMGYHDGPAPAGRQLLDDYRRITDFVRGMFSRIVQAD